MVFDCATIPERLPVNADVSGIGVIISYLGAAGAVVVIVSIHYIVAFDPIQDPFPPENEAERVVRIREFRPNEFDVLFVTWRVRFVAFWRQCYKSLSIRSCSDIHMQGTNVTTDVERCADTAMQVWCGPTRWSAALKKSVLTMSDVQLVTGIATLVSAYAQLSYGITAWHWQQIVYLAWFCSITHQACLTLLRIYLYRHPLERTIRLVFMFFMATMLAIAIIPTSYYYWGVSWDGKFSEYRAEDFVHWWYGARRPMPAEHAICFFWKGYEGADGYNWLDEVSITQAGTARSGLSITMLILGFVFRIVRLHKSLSVNGVGRIRQKVRSSLQWLLHRAHSPCGSHGKLAFVSQLYRLLIHRLLLSGYILLRTSSEFWASMLFETLWLIAMFAWGCMRFFDVRLMYPSEDTRWTYGQIMPVVLLHCPVITILGARYRDDVSLPPGNRKLSLQRMRSGTAITPDSIGLQKGGTDNNNSNDSRLHRAVNCNPQEQSSTDQSLSLSVSATHTAADQALPETGSADTRTNLTSDCPNKDFFNDTTWYSWFMFWFILATVSYLTGFFATIGPFPMAPVGIWLPTVEIDDWPLDYLPVYCLFNALSFLLFSMLVEDFSKGLRTRFSQRVANRVSTSGLSLIVLLNVVIAVFRAYFRASIILYWTVGKWFMIGSLSLYGVLAIATAPLTLLKAC